MKLFQNLQNLQSNWDWNGILFKLFSNDLINDLILHFDEHLILGMYIEAVVLFRGSFCIGKYKTQNTRKRNLEYVWI